MTISKEVRGLVDRAEDMRRLGRHEMAVAFMQMAKKVADREKRNAEK